jgi:hypothetical protein
VGSTRDPPDANKYHHHHHHHQISVPAPYSIGSTISLPQDPAGIDQEPRSSHDPAAEPPLAQSTLLPLPPYTL